MPTAGAVGRRLRLRFAAAQPAASHEDRSVTADVATAGGVRASVRERAHAPRLVFADHLRLVLVVLVIAHHAVEPYASSHAFWTHLPDPPVPGLWAFLWVNAAFFMGALFLLAGAFTPASFDRKGAAAFLRDRAVRLGIPLVFGFLLLIPFQGWIYHLAYRPWPAAGYWDYFVHYYLGFGGKPPGWPGPRWPDLQFGHLWFVEHLLVYAVLYAVWRMLAPTKLRSLRLAPPTHVAIALYAVGLAVATFAIRRWYPQDSWIALLGFIQVEPAHLPQYASLFVIGILAGRGDWLAAMPKRRALPWLALGLGLALAFYVIVGVGLTGRFNSQSFVVCAWEAALCTGLCVGLPVAFRELASRQNALLRALSTNSYAAYVFHFPIVMVLQWLLIGSVLPVAGRILVTVAGGVIATFLLTEFVVLRLPGARRVFGS